MPHLGMVVCCRLSSKSEWMNEWMNEQWWKQDQSVKTKTKTIRPRPLKQQQDCRCITHTHKDPYHSACANRYVIHNRWCIDWLLTHFFSLIMNLTYFIHPLLCTAAGTQCWKQNQNVKTKTKSIRPRPRPVWDRSCHKIAVSDPNTVNEGKTLYR